MKKVLLLISLVLIWPITSTAQDAQRAWKNDCSELICTASKELIDPSSERVVVFLFLRSYKRQETTRLGTVLPLGISVSHGARIKVGEKFLDLPITVCTSTGCQAERNLSPNELTLLGAAQTADFLFVPYGDTRPVSTQMEISGVSGILEAHALNFQ